MSNKTAYPITSEMINPFAAMILGRLFARCEEARKTGDRHRMEDACSHLWYAMKGLNKIAIGVETATYFSVAVMNETRRVR